MYFGWEATNAHHGALYRHNAVYYPTYLGDSARTPRGYKPTFSAIKMPSKKVLLAEGVRSVDRHGHTSDIIYYAADGGTFSAAGPCSSLSAAYVNDVDTAESDAVPRGDESTYRHRLTGEPAINVLLFDGHVEMMTKRKAIETVDLWYPSQTKVRESEFDGSARVDSSPWALDVAPRPKPTALEAIRHRRPDADGWRSIY
jgi:prepilin-type processing-associated H-X9-DG protein